MQHQLAKEAITVQAGKMCVESRGQQSKLFGQRDRTFVHDVITSFSESAAIWSMQERQEHVFLYGAQSRSAPTSVNSWIGNIPLKCLCAFASGVWWSDIFMHIPFISFTHSFSHLSELFCFYASIPLMSRSLWSASHPFSFVPATSFHCLWTIPCCQKRKQWPFQYRVPSPFCLIHSVQ